MAFTAGFSVNVGDPTKATDVTTLAANDDFLKTAVDKIMVDSATPTFALVDGVTATTQSAANNSTKLATTAYADAADVSLTGSTDDTVVTVTAANAMQGEADLTFASNKLTVFGPDGSSAAGSAGVLNLSTRETGVVDADQLGRIDFQAPAETGSDALLVTASIYAEADVAFDATNNATDIVLATAHDGAAAERFRITSQGEIGLAGANYGTDGYVLTSAGAGAAAAWEALPSSGISWDGSTPNGVATFKDSDEATVEANLTFDGTTLNVVGNAGVGIARTDGTLHVHTATCGTETANALGNILVLEDDDNNGMSILVPDASYGQILWGSPSGDGTGDANARIAAGYNSGSQRLDISVGSTNNIFTVNDGGSCNFVGAVTKASGSFRIKHPLESRDGYDLVHSFIEGPQADLLYRGTATLSGGTATVNIDTAARITDGTFVALVNNVQAFTSNETGFDAVRGSVSGNVLTITSADDSSTASISWLVAGERKDAHMLDTDWTDSDGRVITEPETVAPLELEVA